MDTKNKMVMLQIKVPEETYLLLRDMSYQKYGNKAIWKCANQAINEWLVRETEEMEKSSSK